ncbi:MAG: metallophosphoesterase family protein, partial [Clostridia bacterium]
LTHGNTYRVKQGLLMLAYGAREVGADIVLYGHTHIPSVDRDGPLLLINPGALMDGRYAILTFSDNGPVPAMKVL